MYRFTLLIACILGILVLFPAGAQNGDQKNREIENALDAGHYRRADSLLRAGIRQFMATGPADTLGHYIPLLGRLISERDNKTAAANAILDLLARIDERWHSDSTNLNMSQEAAAFFFDNNQLQLAYQLSESALAYSLKLVPANPLKVAVCEYNLGAYAHQIGNIALSQEHHKKSLAIREKTKEVSPRDLYLSYNAMGNMMWYGSKYDSASYYYEKSLAELAKMPEDAMNSHYRPSIIQNNLAGLFSALGRTTDAINAMQESIGHLQAFIASKEDHPKKIDAVSGVYEGIDNLAGIYREIGDYNKARELLRYSYQQKKEKLQPDDPGIFISEILLGQLYNAIREYDSSLFYLQTGLSHLERAESENLFWKADACHTLALVYENKQDIPKARYYYNTAEATYEATMQGDIDLVFMDFLRNAALFHAGHGDFPRAISTAEKVYRYLEKVKEEKTLQGFYQLLNIAEINYVAGHYQAAIDYSNRALHTVKNTLKEGVTVLDSVKIDVFKPRALLVNAQADYALREVKDSAYLSGLSAQLGEALHILEKRKILIDDEESTNILIADNEELIRFAKKIELELYQLTHQSAYLDELINLHESGLYTRIRSRLDKQKALHFSRLPDSVQRQETDMKTAIRQSLTRDKNAGDLINDYLFSIQRWEEHQAVIKEKFPDYYNLRYATLFRPIGALRSSLPDSCTLIRYLFVDSSLYALVVDKEQQKLVQLDATDLNTHITLLAAKHTEPKTATRLLNNLYQALWAPVDPLVKTRRIMIVPDGILFNLSFDLLTPESIASYRELEHKSLLAKYAISYHYSLFLIGNERNGVPDEKNYIAFAPGFSDDSKNQYRSHIKDSLKLDYQYLSLLPQPNMNKLTRELGRVLQGTVYLDDASTRARFKQEAGGHRIIHVGTHAEFNNVNPAQSRLIFSKSNQSESDSNSLYLYDIFSCDMRSQLTILTACETGKPGYEDGEGMISLAHAFNFAGSRSILTGLWKIDEQSSSRITENFITYLQQGLASDEALQHAKLDYLRESEGRVLAPSYWAGLVLMGEPSTIRLESTGVYWPWIAGTILLLILSLVLLFRRKNIS